MQVISGRQVLETVDELVDPAHTALVLVDIQNDYVSAGGVLDKLGYDISSMGPMVSAAREIIDAAHAAGVLVVYIQDTRLPGNACDSAAVLRFLVVKNGLPADVTLLDSWGWQIADEIAPTPGDIVVRKFREGAFVGTSLDLTLRSNGIQTVVMCGDVTHGCLESSARGALLQDYYVVICRQGVGGHEPKLHEASMTVMAAKFDVLNVEEITSQWKRAVRPNG